jgi:hypothetical protein
MGEESELNIQVHEFLLSDYETENVQITFLPKWP